MNTELFITTPRLGTVAVDGTVNIAGTGTDFTAADVGKAIIIRTTAGDKRGVIDTFTDAENVTVATAIDTTQSGCYFYIDYATMDLYDDFLYSLNYTIADIRNPESRNSSYSKTIKLPGTKANNIIFDNIFEIDLEGSFNPNIRAFVIVYSNYIPVFNGNLQLLKINRDGDKIEYDVSIFGKIGDLFQKVADKLLTDLDLSDLDEYGTATNITDSWATPTDLFYPYLDNGRQNISTATPAYISDQIAPAILVSRIFEDILSSVGYSCADTAALYSETGMDKLYIPCLKNWRRRVFIDFHLRGNYTTAGNTGDVDLVIERIRTGTTETVNSICVYGDTASSDSYQTTVELDYGDVVYFNLVPDAANTAGSFTEIDHADTYLKIIYLDTEFNYNVDGLNDLDLAGNLGLAGAGTATVKIRYDNEISDPNNTWSVVNSKHTAPVKHTQGFLPDNYKQRDFLLALIKMFNLYLEPVFDNDTQINILPRDTYYSQGTIIDWTDKIDVGQNIELIPMGELDWKEYLFSWKDDSDFWNKDYKAKTFETYGQRTVIVENDFIATKKKVECEVAPFPLRQSSYNSLVLPNCVKDGVSTIPNIYTGLLRIIYYDANTTTGATTLDGVAKATYPFTGHLTGTAQVPTFDYNWAAPRMVYYTLDDPTLYPFDNNLYTSFWQNFIEEISDKYSKIMVAYFNLTAEDIRELDFRNSFFINGSYFRLNRVIDYNPLGNQLTKCEFIRIRDAVYIASETIVDHGNVEVVDSGPSHPPYASSQAAAASVLVGDAYGNVVAVAVSGDITIDDTGRTEVIALRGRNIEDAAPANGEAYVWVAANNRWEPTAVGGGGTPGGANKQVQYNDGGAFGAEAGFEYDKTTNELTVPDLIDSGLTASEILGTNASKKLVSLAAGTYPSLTELTYLKGATSSVQSQINGKRTDSMATAKILGRNTAGTGVIEELTALPNGITATTQAASDNSTKVATTAYVDSAANWLRLILTAGDQTTTAATVQNITALVTPSLTANKRYHFRGYIHGGCNNTGGVKYAVTIPAGATIFIMYKGTTTAGTVAADSANIASATLSNAFCTENNANRGVYVEGEIALAGTAGTVQFQFASTTAGQTSTIYQLGTLIEYKQLD